MLRLPVLALACLVAIPAMAVRAEAPVVAPTSSASPAVSFEASDGSPHIATAARMVNGGSNAVAAAETGNEPEDKTPEAAPDQPNEAAKPAAPPPPTLTARIDLAQQTMVVSEFGDVKFTWPISSGTSEYPTPRGTFRPEWVAKMWYSRKYDNAPMPNAVFINGGVAVHATQHVSSLGHPASHGCIRLAPVNAKTFYGLVEKHGLKMTRVSIYGTPKWRAPAIASRDEPRYDNDYWFSSGRSYRPVSAFDPRFTQRRYRHAQRYYDDYDRPRVYYRRADGERIVYVQRSPRRASYYYNNGYGSGGGW
jgi:lipoprotein-anchoring transpeptidase ErfK/SrfK